MPSKFDLETGEVHNSMHEVHYFRYACHLINHLHCVLLRFFQSGMRISEIQDCLPSHGYAIYFVILSTILSNGA